MYSLQKSIAAITLEAIPFINISFETLIILSVHIRICDKIIKNLVNNNFLRIPLYIHGMFLVRWPLVFLLLVE